MFSIPECERKISLSFRNKNLLIKALTHRSYLNENPGKCIGHNEMLEFLGDAVLELVITDHLLAKFPCKTEGELTNIRASLVKSEMLSTAAKELNLGSFLLLSKGEDNAGRARNFILADAFEALIGAIYSDQGYQEAKAFVEKHIASRTDHVVREKLFIDPKSRLQEKAQEILKVTPIYRVLKEWGLEHEKHFLVGAYFGDDLIAQAEGTSKKLAEIRAAEAALSIKKWAA